MRICRNGNRSAHLMLSIVLVMVASCSPSSDDKATASDAASKPKFSAVVPKSVTTADTVQTESLGTLEFFDGMPSPQTLDKVYDNLDLARAVTVYLDAIPITSLHAMFQGQRDAGMKVGEVGIFENLMDADTLFLTANTTVIYVFAQMDLSDGPMVLELAPEMMGLIDDAAFKFLIDLGVGGPDEGKGGKYLILPPGYDGDIPEGYLLPKRAHSTTGWRCVRSSKMAIPQRL